MNSERNTEMFSDFITVKGPNQLLRPTDNYQITAPLVLYMQIDRSAGYNSIAPGNRVFGISLAFMESQ